jgi:hypothetical protein
LFHRSEERNSSCSVGIETSPLDPWDLGDIRNISRIIKSGRIRWGGIMRDEAGVNACKFWLENLKGKDNLEDLGVDDAIILRQVSEI